MSPRPFMKLFAVSAAVILVGCGSGGKSKKASDASPPARPSFVDVNTVLEAKCAPCHADGAKHSNLVGHQDTFDKFAADTRTRVTSTDPKEMMPLQLGTTPLTAEETTTFAVYLGKQAKAPDAATPTYAGDIAPLVDAKCAKCHGDKSPFLKFAGHEDAILANADKIYDTIATTDVNEVMPPVTKVLTDAERSTLVGYVDALKR